LAGEHLAIAERLKHLQSCHLRNCKLQQGVPIVEAILRKREGPPLTGI